MAALASLRSAWEEAVVARVRKEMEVSEPRMRERIGVARSQDIVDALRCEYETLQAELSAAHKLVSLQTDEQGDRCCANETAENKSMIVVLAFCCCFNFFAILLHHDLLCSSCAASSLYLLLLLLLLYLYFSCSSP